MPTCIPRAARCLCAAASILASLSAAAFCRATVYQPELAITGADATRGLFGGGRGVIVGVVDGGINASHPALQSSVIDGRDFTGQDNLTDTSGGIGHGTGVAALIAGHDAAIYSGAAPSVKIIDAKVINSQGNTTDAWIESGILYSAQHGAKVINLAVGEPSNRPEVTKLNLVIDYVIQHYGLSLVDAVADANVSAVQDAPGGSYNGISVGSLASSRYWQVMGNSAYALSSDARSKPNLVAPGQNITVAAANFARASTFATANGTSFSSAIVSGITAQMVGYGQTHRLPTDPLLVESILMTSADKEFRYDGTPWTPRSMSYEAPGWKITQPLDPEQGAGRINSQSAYDLYAGKRSTATPIVAWHEGALAQEHEYEMKLGRLTAGERIDATANWLRHISWTDSNHNGGVDAADTFTQSAPLSQFIMVLKLNGVAIATSASPVDNEQALSWTLRHSGTYTLELYRLAGGVRAEDYALSARVLSKPTILNSLPTTADGTPPIGQGHDIEIAAAATASDSSDHYSLRSAASDAVPSFDSSALSPSTDDSGPLPAVPEPTSCAAVIILAALLGLRPAHLSLRRSKH